MAKKVSGWGLFSQKFYDDWEVASTKKKVGIIATIILGFLLIMLATALRRGDI